MPQKLASEHEISLKDTTKPLGGKISLTLPLESKEVSTWIPINPARTVNGAWVSLAKIFGEDKAKPIPLETPNPTLSEFTVVANEVDLTLAAKLGLGNIFSGTLNYGDKAFYMDATAFTERYAEMPNNPVVGTRWGVGLRVLLHASEIKGGLSLNFGLVGAAVQLGYAKALYEIDGIGIEGGMNVILGELKGFGDLTGDTFFRINDIVIPKLADYMEKNPDKLHPVPYQVQLIEPINMDSVLAARSILFAVRRVRDGCSLNEALTKSAGKHDEQDIRMVYAKFAPGLGPDDHASDDMKKKASDWLTDN